MRKFVTESIIQPILGDLQDQLVFHDHEKDACGRALFDVQDYRCVTEFLYAYRGSIHTYMSYRSELERILQWSWHIASKTLLSLHSTDIEHYLEFCQSPPEHWTITSPRSRFIKKDGFLKPNPLWKPFLTPSSLRSQASLQLTLGILGSFYSYWVDRGIISSNVILQMRQKSKFIRKTSMRTVRRLQTHQWQYVIQEAQNMADQNPQMHERTLLMVTLCYGLYLRISEIVASKRWCPVMGHFFKDEDQCWWFKTVGKGNKERHISVSDDVLKALKRYRLFLGLSTPLPYPGEGTILFPKHKTHGPLSSTRSVRYIMKGVFDEAYHRMVQQGLLDDAHELKIVTVHWLRHTGISDDIRSGRPREHVRDDAGHSSGHITDRYIHVISRDRYQSAKLKSIHPID